MQCIENGWKYVKNLSLPAILPDENSRSYAGRSSKTLTIISNFQMLKNHASALSVRFLSNSFRQLIIIWSICWKAKAPKLLFQIFWTSCSTASTIRTLKQKSLDLQNQKQLLQTGASRSQTGSALRLPKHLRRANILTHLQISVISERWLLTLYLLGIRLVKAGS